MKKISRVKFLYARFKPSDWLSYFIILSGSINHHSMKLCTELSVKDWFQEST